MDETVPPADGARVHAVRERCGRCDGAMLIGSGAEPYCPYCERAFHDLEVRALAGADISFQDVIRAMIEDASLSIVGCADDGSAILRITGSRNV